MDARELILGELHNYYRHDPDQAELAGFTCDDHEFLQAAATRIRGGDEKVWLEFGQRLRDNDRLAIAVRTQLERCDYLQFDPSENRCIIACLPMDCVPLSSRDESALLSALSRAQTYTDQAVERRHKRSRTDPDTDQISNSSSEERSL